jgi:hypothetical protein
MIIPFLMACFINDEQEPMKKNRNALKISLIGFLLLSLNSIVFAQTRFQIQLKLPPQGQVGNNYVYQTLSLYNYESETMTIRLKTTVTEESAGIVYEAESANFECPAGFAPLEQSVLQSIQVTQVDPRLKDYIDRYRSLPGGNYNICVTVFVAGSNSPSARDCFREVVHETDPALKNQQPPADSADVIPGPSFKKMFGPYEYAIQCDKSTVYPGEMLTFKIILKSNSLENIPGFRITAPFPAEFALQSRSLGLQRKGQTKINLAPDKFALNAEGGSLILQTDQELSLQDELILTYTVLVNPNAESKVVSNKNVTIETSRPETKNTVNDGPFIEIIRR